MLNQFFKFIDKFLYNKEEKTIFGQTKRMVAKMCHLMKGTIHFIVKFRIIQKIKKKLVCQGRKTYWVTYLVKQKLF